MNDSLFWVGSFVWTGQMSSDSSLNTESFVGFLTNRLLQNTEIKLSDDVDVDLWYTETLKSIPSLARDEGGLQVRHLRVQLVNHLLQVG